LTTHSHNTKPVITQFQNHSPPYQLPNPNQQFDHFSSKPANPQNMFIIITGLALQQPKMFISPHRCINFTIPICTVQAKAHNHNSITSQTNHAQPNLQSHLSARAHKPDTGNPGRVLPLISITATP
jgi:hypothetical protein